MIFLCLPVCMMFTRGTWTSHMLNRWRGLLEVTIFQKKQFTSQVVWGWWWTISSYRKHPFFLLTFGSTPKVWGKSNAVVESLIGFFSKVGFIMANNWCLFVAWYRTTQLVLFFTDQFVVLLCFDQPVVPQKNVTWKRGVSYLFENVSPRLKATFNGGTKLGQFMPRNWRSFVVKCRRKRQGTEAGFGRQHLVASNCVVFSKRKMDFEKHMGEIYLNCWIDRNYHALWWTDSCLLEWLDFFC